jgi:hypothetical protein
MLNISYFEYSCIPDSCKAAKSRSARRLVAGGAPLFDAFSAHWILAIFVSA